MKNLVLFSLDLNECDTIHMFYLLQPEVCTFIFPLYTQGVHRVSQGGLFFAVVQLLSRVRLLATPWTAAYQASPSMEFSSQEYWSGVPLPSPSYNGNRRIFFCLSSVFQDCIIRISNHYFWNFFSQGNYHLVREQSTQWEHITAQSARFFFLKLMWVLVFCFPYLI